MVFLSINFVIIPPAVSNHNDNVVIICSIENLDSMGIHTGDSITIAPQQTLTDKEYQNLRDMAIDIIREIGVDTGGSNIQFAVNPENGQVIDAIVEKTVAEGKLSPLYHALSRPASAEGESTNRAIALAEMAGTPV